MYKILKTINHKNAVNLIILLIGFFLIWNSFFDTNASGTGNMVANSSSGALTKPLSVIWVLLSTVILIKDLIYGFLSKESENTENILPFKLLAVMALMSIIIFLIPTLGFLIAITTSLPLLLVLMGTRGKWRVIVATAILGPTIWFVFHHVLLLRLPSIVPGGML